MQQIRNFFLTMSRNHLFGTIFWRPLFDHFHMPRPPLAAAQRKKETHYPELVVLGVEVGGRWSVETQRFVSLLARAKARCEVSLLRRRAEQAWRLRWGSLLSCTVLLEQWRTPSWNFLVLQVLMATRHFFTRWSARLQAFCENFVRLTSSDVRSSSSISPEF